MQLREIKLPSGATLKVQPSPFAISKALYQALLKEAKEVPFDTKMEMATLWKNLFCIAFSSPTIEACLQECFKRCTFNGGAGDIKIDENTFEPVERRDDYMKVCVEVAKENVLPFVKSLYAEYQHISAILETTPA